MTSTRALPLALLFTVGCNPVLLVPDVPTSDGGLAQDTAIALEDAPELDAPSVDAAPFDGLTYLEDLHPMFEAVGCSTFACHGSTIGGSGLFLYMPSARVAYDDMMERQSIQRSELIVHAGAPDESLLVIHAETENVRVGTLTPAQAAMVRQWVADGAVYSRGGSVGDAGIPDAGIGDGGVGDAGVPLVCALDAERGWPSLPAGCLPRCTQATWDAIVACRSEADPNACQTAAIAMDMTAPITASGASDVLSIDCNVCLSFQTRSCIEEGCLFELLAFDRCFSTRPGDPCTAESNTLNSCRLAHPAVQACQRDRDPLCVGM